MALVCQADAVAADPPLALGRRRMRSSEDSHPLGAWILPMVSRHRDWKPYSQKEENESKATNTRAPPAREQQRFEQDGDLSQNGCTPGHGIEARKQSRIVFRLHQLSCQRALLLRAVQDKPEIRPGPTQKVLRAPCEPLPGSNRAGAWRSLLRIGDEREWPNCLVQPRRLQEPSTSITWSLFRLLTDD